LGGGKIKHLIIYDYFLIPLQRYYNFLKRPNFRKRFFHFLCKSLIISHEKIATEVTIFSTFASLASALLLL